MNNVTVIGIDLAKAHFQLHGNNKDGKMIFRKTLTPEKTMEFLANHPKCIVAMEACGGSHFWARQIREMGHDVRQIPPQYVRAYVVGNHNDSKDAEGIAEAATSSRIRFVPIKSADHQDLQNLHRIRQRLIDNKVALTNQIRGILYEYGIRIPQGDSKLKISLSTILDHETGTLSPMLKQEISDLRDELLSLLERVEVQNDKIAQIAKDDEACKRLMTVPGVGPMISTAIVAAVPDVRNFKNGRQFAAWLGLVPGHKHTGGPTKKVIMLGITKRGDRYLRKLLIQGARGWLLAARRQETRQAKWGVRLFEKKGFNKAAVAIANKNTRIIWALLSGQEEYLPRKAAA